MASTGSEGGSLLDMVPPGFDLCQLAAGNPPDPNDNSDFNDPGLRDVTISVTLIVTIFAVLMGTGRLCANFRKLHLSDCKCRLTVACWSIVADYAARLCVHGDTVQYRSSSGCPYP
jgi:hypothetical protein